MPRCDRELDDEPHEFVLDPVVEIALQALQVVRTAEGKARSLSSIRSDRLKTAQRRQ
jgi:hypothetical protein